MEQDILLSIKEVANILHTNKTYVYQLIYNGLLPALKLGAMKVRKEALLKFLEENEGKDLTIPQNVKDIKRLIVKNEGKN